VQQGLPLYRPAGKIAWAAVSLELGLVTAHSFPALYLSFVVRAAPSHKIAAVPLKPTAWILFVDPALGAPDGQRLGRVNLEKIQLRIVALVTEFGVLKPICRELSLAVGHVLTAKDAQAQHLLWRQVRMKLRMEPASHRRAQGIDVSLLHQIVNDDSF